MDDCEIDNLCKVSNYIIDHSPEPVVFTIDDDVDSFIYRLDTNKTFTDTETIMGEIERIAQIMVDLGIGFGAEDASIVATHLLLAAANAGVDSCWINFFDPDRLARELNLPENEEILMILDLGYAAEGAGPLPNHFARKQLSETVSYL